MVTDILALGNKIELRKINTSIGAKKQEKMYVSQILEFDDEEEDVLCLAMPILEGKLIPLGVGERYELFFFTKRGMYTCDSEVINRYKSQNIYVVVIRMTTELKKYQRRQFFRLETNIEVQYKVFSMEDEKFFRTMGRISDEMYERPYQTGISLDISGGGIRFIANERLNPGDKVMVLLKFLIDGEEYPCEAMAKAVVAYTTKGKENVFENRIEFVQIKDAERELLIKYIFREERNIRKRLME